jgi:hypothetical protein
MLILLVLSILLLIVVIHYLVRRGYLDETDEEWIERQW